MKVMDVHGLDEQDVELVERLVERLRARGRARESGFKRSAGSWKGLIDPDKLIADLYAGRQGHRARK